MLPTPHTTFDRSLVKVARRGTRLPARDRRSSDGGDTPGVPCRPSQRRRRLRQRSRRDRRSRSERRRRGGRARGEVGGLAGGGARRPPDAANVSGRDGRDVSAGRRRTLDARAFRFWKRCCCGGGAPRDRRSEGVIDPSHGFAAAWRRRRRFEFASVCGRMARPAPDVELEETGRLRQRGQVRCSFPPVDGGEMMTARGAVFFFLVWAIVVGADHEGRDASDVPGAERRCKHLVCM